ncbi:MAG: hypothetical protein K2L51_03025, partial [Clostridiales bacterium]|nr:hypothetical protein [Clostridiales bacterium]
MSGNYNDVVVTSRVRLARNAAGLPYPYKLNDNRALQLARKVYEAVNKPLAQTTESGTGENDYAMYRMESISDNSGDVLR